MKKNRCLFTFLFTFIIFQHAFCAPKKYASFIKYIDQYKNLAIKHMNDYNIPASITLAQGILESGAGQSNFVKESNNHFGIKCGADWNGPAIYRTDDAPNECFRVYDRAEDSYDDHSLFLGKSRYSPLFVLDITDYKAWAIGLQTYGYATDRAYANKLIKIIEDYELYKYDTGEPVSNNSKSRSKNKYPPLKRNVYKTFDIIYIIAEAGDSFEKVAYDMGFKEKDLRKYNEVPEGFPLREGDIVYLEKKKKKADKPYYEHVVKVGDSMHSISQLYGLQLASLYKMNHKDDDYVPEEGDTLRIR
ncbi:MAG: glucosaminidase domain-containing protein [Dysgonamonadaceae bacterium]|jgi:LysM repeat protein|nr:glucosaminidase domain-containing protein [Dysgonamonadaceae bacterium]